MIGEKPSAGFPFTIGVDVYDQVVLPASLEERYEVLEAYTIATEHPERVRVLATALALCWPLLREHVRVNVGVEYTGKVLEYGKRVMDALLSNEDPADRRVVLRAGRASLDAIDAATRLISEAIEDPEGPPSPGGTSGSAGSSSPSSDSTTSPAAASEPSIPSSPPTSGATTG